MKRFTIPFISHIARGQQRVAAGRVTRSATSIAIAALASWLLAASASAWEEYSANGGDPTFCGACHGDFRDSTYTSLTDDQPWQDSLHDVHRTMLSGDCDTCHASDEDLPVLLGSSAGGAGLDPISCSGCHGRATDGTGSGSEGFGAGLRQHHWNAGIESCLPCHADSDPADYTPVAESVLPPYYSSNDPSHPLMPSDPCNRVEDGFPEDYAATTLGLDNDGDGLFDAADSVDCPEPATSMMLGVGAGFLLVVGRRRRGSADADTVACATPGRAEQAALAQPDRDSVREWNKATHYV